MSALKTQVGGSHYLDMPIQPIEAMRMVLTPEEYAGYLKGCILKYSMRAGHKSNTDDAGKAKHYAQFLEEHRKGRCEPVPAFPSLMTPAELVAIEDSLRGQA